jgi:hypothetical protein
LGEDGHYYLRNLLFFFFSSFPLFCSLSFSCKVDFGRTFPPEAPIEFSSFCCCCCCCVLCVIVDTFLLFSLTKNHRTNRSVYYHLLRPEFVRSNPVPLNSDAFTRWSVYDPHFDESNQDVEKATLRLIDNIIPNFGKSLDEIDERIPAETSLWDTFQSLRLIEELHRNGIK